MKRFIVFLICLSALAAGTAKAAQPGDTLTNKDILLMVKAGLTSDVVIAKIKSSNCDFDTSPDTLAEMKKSSVPDSIILAMVQAHKAEGETVYVNCTSTEVKRPIRATSFYGSATLAEVGCGDSLISIGKDSYYLKVRTLRGVVGYIREDDVSKTPPQIAKTEAQTQQSVVPSRSSNTAASSKLPPNLLRAVAWRAVPWVTTSYYQQPGTANTDCTGSGSWLGDIWQGNSSCTTRYTPAQSIPINWQHYTIYNLVETSDSLMVIACTRNWAFSKCAYLIPGNTFSFENKNGRISIKGHKGGKGKEQSLDLDIVSSQPKT